MVSREVRARMRELALLGIGAAAIEQRLRGELNGSAPSLRTVQRYVSDAELSRPFALLVDMDVCAALDMRHLWARGKDSAYCQHCLREFPIWQLTLWQVWGHTIDYYEALWLLGDDVSWGPEGRPPIVDRVFDRAERQERE